MRVLVLIENSATSLIDDQKDINENFNLGLRLLCHSELPMDLILLQRHFKAVRGCERPSVTTKGSHAVERIHRPLVTALAHQQA